MSIGRYDALLWDNDGVLVDTERLYYEATREVMLEAGVCLDVATHREHSLRRGEGAWHLVAARGYSELEIERMREARDRRHTELLARPGLAIEGALDVVRALSGKLRMGIVTSAKRVHFERSHKDSGILPHLDLVLTREDYTHSKPHPEPYRLGCARLGVAPERCLVIEDTERGLQAAKAAGLECWVVVSEFSHTPGLAGADRVLEDVREVALHLGAS